jgi:hypothetical protein
MNYASRLCCALPCLGVMAVGWRELPSANGIAMIVLPCLLLLMLIPHSHDLSKKRGGNRPGAK